MGSGGFQLGRVMITPGHAERADAGLAQIAALLARAGPRAARLAGRGPALTPSDVIRCLPDALGERSQGVSELDLPFVLYDADPAR